MKYTDNYGKDAENLAALVVSIAPGHRNDRVYMMQYGQENDSPLGPSVHGGLIPGNLGGKAAEPIFRAQGLDEGLDRVDREILSLILHKFDGGPVGLETLAAALSEEKDPLEDVYEPYLIQEGFLDRTPRGRQATRLAYEYFGRKRQTSGSGQERMF